MNCFPIVLLVATTTVCARATPLETSAGANGRPSPRTNNAARRDLTTVFSTGNVTQTYYTTAAQNGTGLVPNPNFNASDPSNIGIRFFINTPTFPNDKVGCANGQTRKSNGECGEKIPEDR